MVGRLKICLNVLLLQAFKCLVILRPDLYMAFSGGIRKELAAARKRVSWFALNVHYLVLLANNRKAKIMGVADC